MGKEYGDFTKTSFIAESDLLRLPDPSPTNPSTPMLRIIAIILVVGWLLGFSFHLAGSLIHFVLVVAVIVFIIDLIGGRRV